MNWLKKLLGLDGPDVKELLKSGAKLVDVRTPAEFKSGHVKGSVNVPLDQLEKKVSAWNRDEVIVTCCRSGMRSSSAVQRMRAIGFKNVHNGGSWTIIKK
ncbi:MAG: rhodanese-like domain-containing protein [Flavobacteriales bacterium]|nr:rhodanese-like domain-containing protein [Flavobacteriales bacterium]